MHVDGTKLNRRKRRNMGPGRGENKKLVRVGTVSNRDKCIQQET